MNGRRYGGSSLQGIQFGFHPLHLLSQQFGISLVICMEASIMWVLSPEQKSTFLDLIDLSHFRFNLIRLTQRFTGHCKFGSSELSTSQVMLEDPCTHMKRNHSHNITLIMLSLFHPYTKGNTYKSFYCGYPFTQRHTIHRKL